MNVASVPKVAFKDVTVGNIEAAMPNIIHWQFTIDNPAEGLVFHSTFWAR